MELGLAMTAYGLLGGIAQAPVGFLVDRIGPRAVLLVGLGLNAVAIVLMGFAGAYWLLLTLAVLAGLGNSVFHPADYAILNASVNERRLGRAFSIHTFSGFLGGACAPISILVLAQWTSWRVALISTGILGLVALVTMASRREFLDASQPATAGSSTNTVVPDARQLSGMKLLLSPSILLFLLFFILYGMASGGLIAFTVTGLVSLQDIRLAEANTALSGHLFGVVGGILFAGTIVDRYPRHVVTAAVALLLAASATVLPALIPAPASVLVALLTLSGFGLGAVLPARDLMLRALTPSGQVGKVFGFVFVGYSLGASVAPILFGWFLDNERPEQVFVLAALFSILALLATVAASRFAPR